MSVMTTPSTVIHAARKGPRPMTADDLWAIPRVGAPVLSPDGQTFCVVVTEFDMEKNKGTSRIWRGAVNGGDPVALTAPGASSSEPAFSPDGRQLAFVRKDDKGRPQIHVLPLDGGEARAVTSLPLGAFDPHWLPDGKGLVFAGTLLKGHLTAEATTAEIARRDEDPVKAHVTEERVFRFWDTWLTGGEVPHLFVLDLATSALRDLTPDSTTWFDFMEPSGQFDISPDGREVAYAGLLVDAKRSQMRSALFTVPVAGGAITCLTPDRATEELRPRYSPDGRGLLYGQQIEPLYYADRIRLMRFDRATAAHHAVLVDWDLTPLHWEFVADGRIAFEAEEDGRVSLFTLVPGAAAPERRVRGGASSGFDVGPDGRFVFGLQTLVAPVEVYGAAADGAGVQRLTRFTDAATSRFATGEVREIPVEGAKSEQVQMYVVLPPDYEEGRRYPLVHVIHGGPHAISADAFHARWNAQLFAAPGHVVALVNFQGSTSWGQDFARRIQGAWAERPFEDVMRATDLLIASGLVDEQRMAAAGGSYGGYMASWIEGHTDRFRCIVNHAGVYDTLSQYASDVTQGREQSFGGEPWDGLEAINACNPAHAAAGFKTPMLVIHGERDFRVPVTQGLECYGVLKAKGVPARLVYFPDENHWILKPRNSRFWYAEVLGWLERWLKN